MKKIFAHLIAAAFCLFIACNSAQHKTGNDKPDTGSKHGDSGASDTVNGSEAPFAQSTAGTDTSTDGHGVDDPVIDTTHPKPPSKKHH
ncbi:hypothetical protein [Mucilaginibacter panaciglaebae]|uniref:Lipoprotein n=1 Tax=Mucilaginibacter panaciglaebae TaxID=502331 RepID=A0ABP7X327_9SPHI